jgi:hypothetical protein
MSLMAVLVLEFVAAAGGVTLAIIGLAGAAPRPVAAIAIITLGAAFLLERWAAELYRGDVLPDLGRLTWASIAGGAGIVLGIRSLFYPDWIAPAIALIFFGVALALSPWPSSRAIRVLAGMGAVVLGVLALARIAAPTLTLAGSIVVGSALASTERILPGVVRRRVRTLQ